MDFERRLPSLVWVGVKESCEGLHKTKTSLSGARWNSASRLPLYSNCNFPMDLKPAGLPYRFWIYQDRTITGGNSLESSNLNLSFFLSLSLPPTFPPSTYMNFLWPRPLLLAHASSFPQLLTMVSWTLYCIIFQAFVI